MSEQEPTASERVTRVIDFRIPLPWLIGGVLGICWSLISMYFSVNALVKTVNDLQIDVKAGNNSVVSVVGELALIKYRLTDVEVRMERIAKKEPLK